MDGLYCAVMPRGNPAADAEDGLWDQPEAPSRPHQLPYSPAWEKKRGVDLYILRMNREVNRFVLQRGLFRLFKEHILIMHLSVDADLFGNIYGHLVLLNHADMRAIVKRFHKTTFYGKSIEFSEVSPVIPVPLAYKRAVIGIFQEQKRSHLLLAELIGLFEEKYDQPMGISDLLKMPDIVERFAAGDIQMVRLLPYSLVWQTNLARQGCLDTLPLAQCSKDCGNQRGYLARISGTKSLTCYRVSLRVFIPQVLQLLDYHDNCMNLNTFIPCYEAMFGHLPEDDEHGVFLDHLLTAVPGVSIVQQPFRSRQLILDHVNAAVANSFSPNLNQFHREVLDMLMVHHRATVPFGEFVQTYRVHYGKMCRVADFGCTRLAELLLLFSSDIQILGIGNSRMITLTHEAQMQRFQRILKHVKLTCGIQRIDARNFILLYQFVCKKVFCAADFGICYLEDLLEPMPPLRHGKMHLMASTSLPVETKCALFSIGKFRDTLAAIRDTKHKEELDDSGILSTAGTCDPYKETASLSPGLSSLSGEMHSVDSEFETSSNVSCGSDSEPEVEKQPLIISTRLALRFY
ncbi:meiosis regulator and mRNA stability factor 1-like isoform X2 [Paramacrobiotus metropolitanus]|uniref:meiosis regulator and mRNA stability factor 1-like isoform X2 n=1 Tax=Paramacrobiotus metropolitanus TaxID=2943436 RepID=UPI0024456B7C|nr:meiosis regulator and mRNA stability factor 1-like isoform X2 [Paramacrobiotus metropolitanus]